MDKIDKTIAYYNTKISAVLDFVNSSDNLTAEDVIEKGEELSILEYKLTALEVAKEN